ncbi:iron ABC transporter permease [Brevundimonas terrae]|uniref:Iron ABC transporter permease n=1 Tax=Brevundimonas terrae TaxID=363631 RepID=A0ABN0YHW7_9CAUL|nr:iron ABC transporter permease [Brevundimonas terrae]NIJ27151.1 iron(III) transport system permease protein [Brevundimonas terrae]
MHVLGWAAAVVALLPLLGVVFAALQPGRADIAFKDIARYATTSGVVALGVAIVTGVVGTLAAWLVALHRFPMRGVFAWALALPLAVPAFALAYSYSQIFDVGGLFRMWLRPAMGFDIPLQMRSIPGAIFVLSCAFYPYVFLAMRAAFVSQSVHPVEAARMLGCSVGEAFRRTALPLARPALAAGIALAVMETLADYGAVQFLSVQTLTTGVVRAWSVYGSPASAARFALPLLVTAAALFALERWGRQGRRFETTRGQQRTLEPVALSGLKAWGATLFCLLILTLGLLLPVGYLLWRSLEVTPDWARLWTATGRTLSMGLIGAAATVALATLLALGARHMPVVTRIASLGYATPGAVMAIGLLGPATVLWTIAPSTISGAGVSVALLVYAYAARLMAAALEPIEAGLSKVTPAMGFAARSLGHGEFSTAARIQLPIAKGALLTAGLIVFVDVLKELPATLILRPFDFDTLAVLASNYALDERLAQAGWPSLLIIGLALPGVIWLTRQVTKTGRARTTKE